jgi:hypothetical protein
MGRFAVFLLLTLAATAVPFPVMATELSRSGPSAGPEQASGEVQRVFREATAPSRSPQAARVGSRRIWVPDHWERQGDQWVWVQGHFVEFPNSDHHWESGHWRKRSPGWIWVPGHWAHD